MSVFAQRWNRHHGLRGHVWGERFFSRIIGSLADLVSTFLYIDLNPVRAGLAVRSEDWLFGGSYWRAQLKQDLIDLETEGREQTEN
jgi:putative transposase